MGESPQVSFNEQSFVSAFSVFLSSSFTLELTHIVFLIIFRCKMIHVKASSSSSSPPVIFILLKFFYCGNFGFCFSTYDFLALTPHFAKDFHQIVIFTSDNQLAPSSLEFVKREDLLLVEIQWKDRVNFLNQIVDIDNDPNTAIFIDGRDSGQLSEMISEITKKFVENVEAHRIPNATEIDINFPWNAFYFLLWPKPISDDDDADENELTNFLQNITKFLHFPLNSDIYCVAQKHDTINKEKKSRRSSFLDDGDDTKFFIWEMYSVKENLFVERVHEDILRKDFLWKLIKYKYRRRNNFHGAVITATAVIDEVYIEETKWKENSTTELESGVAVAIYRLFRDHLNFHEQAMVGEYMFASANDSSFDEMQVYLINGTADIAITESAVGLDKAQVIQYLHAVAANWLEARFIDESNSKLHFFLSPFSHSVWLLVTLYIFFTVASLTFLRYSGVKSHEVEDEFYQIRHHPQVMDWGTRFFNFCSLIHLNFLWILGTLCQQGWYEWPTKTPMKILCLVASMTGFLLFAAYAGTLTSQLSVSEHNTAKFENLLNWSYTFYMEVDFSFPVDNNHSDPSKNVRVLTMEAVEDVVFAIGNISKPKRAMISFPEFFYAGVRKAGMEDGEACECFTTVRTSRTPNLCAMAVSKSSPFKEIFNIKTLLIWERGIVPRLTVEYMKKTQLRCTETHTHKPQKIRELFIAFALISSGLVLSLCVLFVENCVKLYENFREGRRRSRHVRELEKRGFLFTLTLSTTSSSTTTTSYD